MSDIWHSKYTIPARCREYVPVEIEFVTGKYGLRYTAGYGFTENEGSCTSLGWLCWVERWRFIFDEEDVKEVPM